MTNDEYVYNLNRHIKALYILIAIVFCLCIGLLYQTNQYKQKFVTRQLVAETINTSQSISIEGENTKVLLSNFPSITMSRTYPGDTKDNESASNSAQIGLRITDPGGIQGPMISMSQNRYNHPNAPDSGSLRLGCTGNFIGLDIQARGTDQGDGVITEPIYFGISGRSSGEPTPRYRPYYHLPEFDKARNKFYPPFENQ